MTFLLFVAGVNYDNTMILNFSFFLVSLFVVNILQTFSNLSGMEVSAGHSEPAFVGAEAKFLFRGAAVPPISTHPPPSTMQQCEGWHPKQQFARQFVGRTAGARIGKRFRVRSYVD